MHVFVTGATGWVGSAIVADLLAAGHHVMGLVRSPEKARALARFGVEPVKGGLDDVLALRTAASRADAVIHTAFNHDYARFLESAEEDRSVIATLGAALEGSERPLLVTSGLLGLRAGATEVDLPGPSPRKSEPAARLLAERGVRAATVRLAPSVHGIGDHGFVPLLIDMARRAGVSAYIEDSDNAWSGVHRSDAARVYRLALETGVTQTVYHAVAEEAVSFRAIAEAIGKGLGLPVEARPREHFGWFAHFAAANMNASNARTHSVLQWTPTGPSLMEDLGKADYFSL